MFLSASVHATPRCDNDAHAFLNYYATELPKKLIVATPDQLTQLVTTEIEKVEEDVSFCKSHINIIVYTWI